MCQCRYWRRCHGREDQGGEEGSAHLEQPRDSLPLSAVLIGVAVGRKNQYGSRSLHGTRVAALFYSLLESAKRVGVNPATYLAEATRRAIASPGTVTLPRDLR